MNIALALSGGGFRATVFHLGVLARLAKENRLEDVTLLSTVSGGSLCAGLVFALNDYQWPSSDEYLDHVLPSAKKLLTTTNMKTALIKAVILNIWDLFEPRADEFATLLAKLWGIQASLDELPASPRWMINATCYETGKNWRFERFRMGDYIYGYTYDTHIPLSQAMAASAGFPGLIGALELDTSSQTWFQYADRKSESPSMAVETIQKRITSEVQPMFPEVHLWDGGVYDNHGLEGLFDFDSGWKKDIEFLIVSDAAGRSQPEAYQRGSKALLRIITGVMMDQIRSLRARAILERIINHGDRGAFLQIGNTCEDVMRGAGKQGEISAICPGCLKPGEAAQVASMTTDIAKLTTKQFDQVFRHGFEVADYTLYGYSSDLFHQISSNG